MDVNMKKMQPLLERVALSCGVGHRHGSGLMLLQLWYRTAAADQIRPLAWEIPYAVGEALKSNIYFFK